MRAESGRRRSADRSAPQQHQRRRPVPQVVVSGPRCRGGRGRGGSPQYRTAAPRQRWRIRAGRSAPQPRRRCRPAVGGCVRAAAGGPLATVQRRCPAAASAPPPHSCVGAAAPYHRPRRAARGGKSAAMDPRGCSGDGVGGRGERAVWKKRSCPCLGGKCHFAPLQASQPTAAKGNIITAAV